MIAVVPVEIVNGVSVVPEYPEILRGGSQRGKSSHDLVAVSHSVGIGIFRNAPDTLYRFIRRDEFFDDVHIRSVFEQRHVDHVDAETLGHGKMSVIAGNDAEERDPVILRPRFFGAEDTCEHRVRKRVVHQFQRRTVSRDDHVGSNSHKIRENTFHLGYAVKNAVVSQIDAALAVTVLVRDYIREKRFGKIELIGTRLSSRHIERKPARLVLLIFLFQLRKFIFGKSVHNFTPVRPGKLQSPICLYSAKKYSP